MQRHAQSFSRPASRPFLVQKGGLSVKPDSLSQRSEERYYIYSEGVVEPASPRLAIVRAVVGVRIKAGENSDGYL